MKHRFGIVLCIVLSVVAFSCKNMKNKMLIRGKLTNSTKEYIYLQELTVANDGRVDSVLVNKSGKFLFERALSQPSFFRLWFANRPGQVTLAIQPGEKVRVDGDATKFFESYEVSGSPDSKLAQQVTRRLNQSTRQIDSLNQVFTQFKNNPNFENIKQILTLNYNKLVADQRDFSIKFIESNPTSIVSILVLYQQLSNNTWVFYDENDLRYFSKVDSAIYKVYPEAPFVNSLHGNVASMKEQQNAIKMQQMMSAMGAKAPEIALASPKGDTIRLTSLRGKYVLLDFWASWCKPCRQENPNLVKLYRLYKAKGFEIFQVSLDKSKDAWINAIKTDGLWWKHGCDLKFWQSPVVKLYNFESIPTSFLLDKDGVIIAKGLRGESLERKLEEIFGSTNNTTDK